MTRGVAGPSLIIVISCFSFGQPVAAPPAFEVASIRLSEPRLTGTNILCESGRFRVYAATLKSLIKLAWRVRDVQVLGGPGWVETTQYYVSAQAGQSVPDVQCEVMLQTLLTDRFKLSLRRDSRELPVYALVVDRGGPKFHESEASVRVNLSGSRGKLNAQKIGMGNLARFLSGEMDLPVLDRTGLTGRYSFTLEWTPEGQPGPDGVAAQAADSLNFSGPSIFTAVKEQLGLKLETQKAPVDVFVIDHVEKPSEN
jgi:uncharacterized protein (TIGR03435 family)